MGATMFLNYYCGGLTISHKLLRGVTAFAVYYVNETLGFT